MPEITMDGQYQTGETPPRIARILCVDGPEPNYPVVGIVGTGIFSWTSAGGSPLRTMSLAPVPVPKILDWVPLEWFDITPGVTLFGLAGRPASASVALFRCEIHVTLIGVHTVCRTYKELFEDTDRTYSNDGGKTWNQCGKIVEKDQ